MTASFIMSGNGDLTLVLKGNPHTVSTDHANYDKISKGLKRLSEEDLLNLVDVGEALKVYEGISVKDGVVYFKDRPMHNTLTRRILDFLQRGLPFEPMANFLGNLMQNPSARAVNELYDFLENKNLPVTEDGCFLAYKTVRSNNYRDWYSNTIDNSVGSVVEIERNTVDDNRERECSYGLHVGALDYLNWYNPCGAFMIVKVNPRDCVSVPKDHNAQKLRVCRYEVLCEMTNREVPLEEPVYSSDGGEYSFEAEDYEDFEAEDYEQEEENNYTSPKISEELLVDEIRNDIEYYANYFGRDSLITLAAETLKKPKRYFKSIGKRQTILELLQDSYFDEADQLKITKILETYMDADLAFCSTRSE